MGFIHKILAFVRRDFLIAASYRLSFFLQFWGIFFQVVLFYYISVVFGEAASTHLERFGGGYFSFALIGIAFSRLMLWGVSSFAGSISREQLMGTLEAMLATRTSIPLIVTSSALWSLIWTLFQVGTYILIGSAFFNLRLEVGHPGPLLVLLVLSTVTSASVGIISAAFIMVFKRGDPFGRLSASFSMLFGGVFFPITVLPAWLQKVSHLLPIYYSLDGMRIALLKRGGFAAVAGDIAGLAVLSAVLVPLSLLSFNYAVRRAKIDGSLIQY